MKKSTVVIIACIGIVLCWSANWYFVKRYYGCDTTGAGTFGDLFGATNALFSGLTIVGLIYTIILQRDEIHTTKEDARKQLRIARYQRFDDTLFKMIDLHIRHYNELNTPIAYFEEKQIQPLLSNPGSTFANMREHYIEQVERQEVYRNFGNYLLTFQEIVNFICSMKKKKDNKMKYLKLYFAQFHINEKRMLWFHFCLTRTKPQHWDLFKEYLFTDLYLSHINEEVAKRFDDMEIKLPSVTRTPPPQPPSVSMPTFHK